MFVKLLYISTQLPVHTESSVVACSHYSVNQSISKQVDTLIPYKMKYWREHYLAKHL